MCVWKFSQKEKNCYLIFWFVELGNHKCIKIRNCSFAFQRGLLPEKYEQYYFYVIIHLTFCIYLQEVRSLMKSQKPEDLILALKTVGNAGYPDFISDIKPIIEDKSKSQIIRAQAIYSLRKITAYIPEAVS